LADWGLTQPLFGVAMGYDESSGLNIFIDIVGHKAPEAVTAEDIDSFADHGYLAVDDWPGVDIGEPA
jgi:hypothetical protein